MALPNNTSSKRLEWVDLAKGIGTLLVIIGHTLPYNKSLTEKHILAIIYSFHMPLFFMLSSITYKFSSNKTEFLGKVKKSWHHLMIPFLGVFIVQTFIKLDTSELNGIVGHIQERLLALLYCCADTVNTFYRTIPALGIQWFLAVLFMSRSLFDYLHLKFKKPLFVVAICLLTLLGASITKIQWLPLALDVVFATQIFLFIGNYLKTKMQKEVKLRFVFISLILWLLTFEWSYITQNEILSLSSRVLPLFPICFISATFGSLFIILISKLVVKHSCVKPIIFIGKHALIFYIVHSIEDCFYHTAYKGIENRIIKISVRIFVISVISLILIKIISLIKSRKQENI